MGGVIERRGELWSALDAEAGAWVVIPTNGVLDRAGRLVMGAGVAGAAKARWPHLPLTLGLAVAQAGNVPVASAEDRVLTWPTKPGRHTLADGSAHPGWQCMARVRCDECWRAVASLTAASGPALVALVDRLGLAGPVLMPRVGCGLGGLEWAKVGPWAARLLDDRFVVLHPGS